MKEIDEFNEILIKFNDHFNLINEILESKLLTFDNQKSIIEFYKYSIESDAIQSQIILSWNDKNNFNQINFLSNKLKNLIRIYDNKKVFFDNQNINQICKVKTEDEDSIILSQKIKLEIISKEQHELQDIVRHLGNYKENENELLLIKYNKKRTEYLNEKSIYSSLISKKYLIYNDIMTRYSKNVFKKINDQNLKLLSFVESLIVSENENIVIYFNENLVNKLYELTNNETFEEISYEGFFNNLNLISSNEILKIKKNSSVYTCYLIKKLSLKIKSTDKKYWRGQILKKVELTEQYKKKSNQLKLDMTDKNRAKIFHDRLHEIIEEVCKDS